MIWTGWATPDLRRMSWSDRLAWIIGSGFGSGLSPIAPGTAGAGVAVVIHCIIMFAMPSGIPNAELTRLVVLASITVVAFFVGVWATGRMSTHDDPDPGSAVWDEFVGMWITLLPTTWATWDLSDSVNPPWWPLWWVVLGFFYFRAFDTMKPWPCRRLEDLHGGLGIMLDDVAAGIWGLIASTLTFVAIWLVMLYSA